MEPVVPTAGQFRHLRACMVCSIVQMHSKFRQSGCPNCEPFLDLQQNEDAIQECTSSVFEGTITLIDPKTSWVARWQRLENYAPGSYAVKVVGTLPKDVLDNMENRGYRYIPRDGTSIEEVQDLA